MKLSVLQFFSWPGRRNDIRTVYERAFERIDVMESAGYDSVWLAEHHFTDYSVCPSVHMMGAHIAARTTKLRIGMGVSLAAFYHPLRLAEEIALLDVLSDGRVDWGAGRGFDAAEYRVFGVDRDMSYSLFRENVEIVKQAWLSESLTFNGQHWQFEGVEVLPKPVQQPHPPIWTAATSPEAIIWSAQNAYSILMDPHAPHVEIKAKRALYEKELTNAGHSMKDREIPVARSIAIGETDGEARRVARAGAEFMLGRYLAKYLEQEHKDPVDSYVDDVVICGTPDKVVEQILRLREFLPLDSLVCVPLSHRTFELFTEKVLPRIR